MNFDFPTMMVDSIEAVFNKKDKLIIKDIR